MRDLGASPVTDLVRGTRCKHMAQKHDNQWQTKTLAGIRCRHNGLSFVASALVCCTVLCFCLLLTCWPPTRSRSNLLPRIYHKTPSPGKHKDLGQKRECLGSMLRLPD